MSENSRDFSLKAQLDDIMGALTHKKLIEKMARAIAKHPDLVKVTQTWKDNTLTLELDVAHIDKGKIIGKQGNVVDAMRTILATASIHSKKHVMLEIAD